MDQQKRKVTYFINIQNKKNIFLPEEIRRPDPIGAESVPQPFEKSIEMPSAGEGANGQPKGESADGRPLTWMEYVKSELSKSDSTDTN